MAKFYDHLTGQVVEMVDWLDRTGSKERGRRHRNTTESKGVPSGIQQASSRPGLGTPYITGSHNGSTPKKVISLLDSGDNVDLLSPGI